MRHRFRLLPGHDRGFLFAASWIIGTTGDAAGAMSFTGSATEDVVAVAGSALPRSGAGWSAGALLIGFSGASAATTR